MAPPIRTVFGARGIVFLLIGYFCYAGPAPTIVFEPDPRLLPEEPRELELHSSLQKMRESVAVSLELEGHRNEAFQVNENASETEFID